MRKYITLNFFICIFLSVFIVVGAAFWLFINELSKDKTESLKTLAQTVKISQIPDGTDLEAFSLQIAATSADLRVTLIARDGMVLADSQNTDAEYENHISREEIADALQCGTGESSRLSRTTGVYTVYVARELDDGSILRLAYPVGSIYSFVWNMFFVVVAVFAIVLIFVYAFARRFSKRLMYPLHEINRLLETKAISEEEIKQKPFKEVEPLLKNIEYLIKKLNDDLLQIKKTERMRSDFVANASHELKSPLTSIKGFAELMQGGLITDEAQKKEYLGRIVAESDRLLSIINDILQLSQAESVEADKSRFEKVDLKVLTSEIFAALEPLAAKKNIVLSCEGSTTVNCEKKDFWELIYNLVDNSVRYGNEGGYVRVLLRNENGTSIVVEDNGIGIPPEHKPRVFERFYRVDKSRSRKSGGTGLGLSIVRNLTVKYGGTVLLESEEGKGTKISCSFPNRPVPRQDTTK